jgi:hypothetical protein
MITTGCDYKKTNDDKDIIVVNDVIEKQDIIIKYTEDGIIEPAIAKELIKEVSNNVIKAIAEKDIEVLVESVHPVKGVRLSPYTYVSLDKDKIISREEMKGFFSDKEEYLFGVYDGIGDDIRLTLSDYYNEFIYPVDYLNAEQIGYNEIFSKGNMINNQFEVYEDAIVVEYYFSGFKEEYGGVDWKSLRLVYEEYEGTWVLVGIIHNQWTV